MEVEFTTRDANDQPVSGAGLVRVTRDYWFEIWLSPEGREIKGDELQRWRSQGSFPPVQVLGQKPWRLKFRGYEQDEILSRTLKSGTNGAVSFSFTPEREGYYRISWRTDEEIKAGTIPSRPIRAETTAWVTDGRSAELGYRSGGLEIILDKDTFRAGEKAPVMISAPAEDRYVLFTTSGRDLMHYQLLHLTGTVKLVELEINESHQRNFFITAAMVDQQQIFLEQKEVVVPPTRNFLTVDLKSDRDEYQPGEKGTLQVRTRDYEGKPVAAEVALSVFDEAISYIQQEYASDPRQFFFGTKRPSILNNSSSFQFRPYRKVPALAEDEAAELDSRTGMRDELYSKDKKETRNVSGVAAAPRQISAAAADVGSVFNAKASAETRRSPFQEKAAQTSPAAGEAAIQVRSDFRSALFWTPDLRTDLNGEAELSFTYPDSLTTWKAVARAVTTGTQFGAGTESTRTKQPVIIRLQTPRFLLEGDTVTISAVVNNNTPENLTMNVRLETEGIGQPDNNSQSLWVQAGAEGRVNWTLHPSQAGEIKLKTQVRAGRFADAMERKLTVYEHGLEKFVAVSGKARIGDALARLDLPAERKAGSTSLTIQVTPSLAVAMLEALPYLVAYPYGCTEQTISRFVPAVLTAKTLRELGLNPEDIMGRTFGGLSSNSIPRQGGQENLGKLDEITALGLQRLADFQHKDGGWGWWKEGESDSFMTAYVVWGLALATDAGVLVKQELIERGTAFLGLRLVQSEREYDLQSFLL
ncbi:MAG TPA: alpha-2-macroglobulin family protein, partial [Verrucomicrobiae bacterium]|nr:alpha-2-macroglobulin family protein [Verrucomicrobiae bacterium]